MGIKYKANPTKAQKEILSQWMGCSRVIWNAKCEEDVYLRAFSKRYLPIGTYTDIDQSFSKYKDKELTPWLYHCPSQILRNTARNWYQTYWKFIKGECGRPKRKKKTDEGSIHLTNELFEFRKNKGGSSQLFIGSKTTNIGILSIRIHRKVEKPKSIYIKKKHGVYTVSFCFDDGVPNSSLVSPKAHLKKLYKKSLEELTQITEGIDRGVAVMAQGSAQSYDYKVIEKERLRLLERKRNRYQKRLSRQLLRSNRRKKTKSQLSKLHTKESNIRTNFCHQTSHRLVSDSKKEVIVFEHLKTKNMTRKPKAKQDEKGRWLKNKATAKAGLNKAILSKGWHKLELFTTYKAHRANKVVFKVSPHYTSQECADCGHIHPDNRQTRDQFVCLSCGHSEHADVNASLVIKKRAITLIKHSGTELSESGVLTNSDIGHGDIYKSLLEISSQARIEKPARRKKLSKKKELLPCV